MGLPEREDQQTRAALSSAALRLAVERGLADVTVNEIAAAAGVSPRTFNDYFSSPSEAVVWGPFYPFVRIAGQLRARPTTEPLWTALTAATRAVFGTPDPADPGAMAAWATGAGFVRAQPELLGESLHAAAAAERELATAVSERTGHDPGWEIFPTLVAEEVWRAVLVAVAQWLRADPPVALASLLDDALLRSAARLPDPRPT